MTNLAAIQGTFADFKTVKSRSVVQIVIEIPIEAGKHAIDVLGFPQPGAEIPVALARLDPEHVSAAASSVTADPAGANGVKSASPRGDVPEGDEGKPGHQPEPVSRSWSELPYPQRAGIRCGEPAYQEFLMLKFKDKMLLSTINWCDMKASDVAALLQREACCVKSRSEIKPGTPAAAAFDRIESDYQFWLRHPEAV
jgi:hypothetical protein